MSFKRNILITGGAGFIGSHVIRYFVKKYPDYHIINLDKLTYAGNLENLLDVEHYKNYNFIKGDITDTKFIENIFEEHSVDSLIHLAAESHVDRSITNPTEFVFTNVIGTVNLLNAAKKYWDISDKKHLFYHISTDEVFGSLNNNDLFSEKTPYDPRSPYSASKASADHFVRAYHNTYKLPIIISNCSNNYGPYQFPEKLIPLCIHNIKENQPIPIYGKGENVRDWLYVIDHVCAMDAIFHQGKYGDTYLIGGNCEMKNIDLVNIICDQMDKQLGREGGKSAKLITYVQDRAGHDLRYAIDNNKIKDELKWSPTVSFAEGIKKTILWYLENEKWLSNITTGKYKEYYEKQYGIPK